MEKNLKKRKKITNFFFETFPKSGLGSSILFVAGIVAPADALVVTATVVVVLLAQLLLLF